MDAIDIETEPELRKKVEARLAFKVSTDRWQEAKEEHAPYPPWGNADVAALYKALREPGQRRRNLFGKAEVGSDQRFALPEVQRIVQECRLFLFGAVDPPFKDLATAERWIVERAQAENESAESSPTFGFPSDLAQFTTPVILAFPGKEAVARVMIPALCRLAALALAGRQIADATLCEQYQAVGHVLTGIPVLIWPVKVTETVGLGGPMNPRRVTLDINFDWVTKADVADFYQDVREPASPVSRDDCLRTLPRHISGTPEERMRIWNKKYPQWAYDTVPAFKTAMSRALRRPRRLDRRTKPHRT